MSKIAGIARITMDGELLESLPGAELDLGGKEREMVSGHSVYGYKEKVVPAMLTCTIVWKNETPVEEIRDHVDGLILFEADNGITYKVSNSVCTKTVKVKDESGEVTLEFGGNPAKAQ